MQVKIGGLTTVVWTTIVCTNIIAWSALRRRPTIMMLRSEFTEAFAARGPFDSKHRTLREFDLKTRMFRYPLSYRIYSQVFNGLTAEARDRVTLRLWEVLTGKDQTRPFEHLSAEDRRAVLEILRETKKDLPAY